MAPHPLESPFLQPNHRSPKVSRYLLPSDRATTALAFPNNRDSDRRRGASEREPLLPSSLSTGPTRPPPPPRHMPLHDPAACGGYHNHAESSSGSSSCSIKPDAAVAFRVVHGSDESSFLNWPIMEKVKNSKLAHWSSKVAVESEPGLTTAQLMLLYVIHPSPA